MRYGSVCSGIEAATCAWHPLGWHPQFYSEIDKNAASFLARKYPAVPNYGDMTKFQDWPDHAIDLLVGGTPCQSFSVAGLRKGLADPRGNLMLTYLAIADRYRPAWLVWENVPGVLSSNGGRDFGSFIGGLGQLGYGFAYRVLDAQFVRVESHPWAVPQRRRRVFVVGHLGDWRRAAAVLFERESLSGHPPPRREAGQGVAPTIAARTRGGGGLGTDFDCDGGLIAGPAVSPALKARDAKGPSSDGDGDGAPLIAQAMQSSVAHALRGEGHDASEDGTGRGTPIVPVAVADTLVSNGDAHSGFRDERGLLPIAIQGAATRENPSSGPDGVGVRTDGAAFTLEARQEVQAGAFDTTQITSPGNFSNPKIGDPSPPLVKDGHPMTLAIRGRGDSHNLEYRQDGTANAVLTPNGGRGGIGVGAIAHGWAVRRLTPLECTRLQGFPDDYFQVPGKPFADGPIYKMLGNSMAVNCMRWLGERIEQVSKIPSSEAA